MVVLTASHLSAADGNWDTSGNKDGGGKVEKAKSQVRGSQGLCLIREIATD